MNKWEILQRKLAEARAEVERIQADLEWMERTPFTANGTGTCSACGQVLPTEADFARHFTVPDEQYYNLGYCPQQSPTDTPPAAYR